MTENPVFVDLSPLYGRRCSVKPYKRGAPPIEGEVVGAKIPNRRAGGGHLPSASAVIK